MWQLFVHGLEGRTYCIDVEKLRVSQPFCYAETQGKCIVYCHTDELSLEGLK